MKKIMLLVLSFAFISSCTNRHTPPVAESSDVVENDQPIPEPAPTPMEDSGDEVSADPSPTPEEDSGGVQEVESTGNL